MKKLLLAFAAFAFLCAAQAKADDAKPADADKKADKPAKKGHKKGKKKADKPADAAPAK
jgi:hypothetical protein